MYAIVDIETTGGYAQSNGITEIAIFIHDGQRVVDSYSTLIDPGMHIPDYIVGFTGITNAMVESAPAFENVAHTIFDLLDGKVFIAHSVNFDYSFVKSQLAHAGYKLNSRKLCTVRYSRKVFPGLPSYSLGNICAHLGIDIESRHRAGGDAEATVKLFERLLENDPGLSIMNTFLKKGSKEYQLPPNLSREEFEKLPETTGVYYMHDEHGKVVYVGKALNIRSRVGQHFTGHSTSKQRQDFMRSVHSVSFEECATELMALILESIEIKKHWPAFNRALKHKEFSFALYSYEDRNGYLRISVERIRKHLKPVATFRTMSEALGQLQELITEFYLCPKLCNVDVSDRPCDPEACNGACEKRESPDTYNERIFEAIAAVTDEDSFAIIGKGFHEDEMSCVLIDRGLFYGMGVLSRDIPITSVDELKSMIQPMKGNFFIRELLDSESISQWGKKIMLNS